MVIGRRFDESKILVLILGIKLNFDMDRVESIVVRCFNTNFQWLIINQWYLLLNFVWFRWLPLVD